MSVFRKSVGIVGPTQIAGYAQVTAGNIALPAYLPSIGYGTQLTINSAANISAVTFSVTGSFNGFIIQEDMQGPNVGSSTSNYFYDRIISISASANLAQAYNIATGAYSIVIFDSYNTNNDNNVNYNNINVLVRSLTVGVEGWGNGNYFVYGVSGKRPDVINNQYVTPNLTYDVLALESGYPPSNKLTFINDIMDDITQLKLQNGYIVGTTYPYDSVIVYLTNILATPTFLEITQS